MSKKNKKNGKDDTIRRLKAQLKGLKNAGGSGIPVSSVPSGVVPDPPKPKKMDHDEVTLSMSPVMIPPPMLHNVSCPYLGNIPIGIEMRIQHMPKELPKDDNEFSFTAVHVAADHSGCGWWRLHEIEDCINYNKRGYVMNTSVFLPIEMLLSYNFNAIRLQRQIGYNREQYWKDLRYALRETCKRTRLIYEIDDVVCDDKIPEFNQARAAFATEESQTSLHNILDLVDEFTVVSRYMREVYHRWHPTVPISVIPNFATRGWFDGFYDFDRRMKLYDKNKKRPRVLISGGATHVNPGDLSLYSGDYGHAVDAIISARNDFRFIFMGVMPNQFRPFIESGEMEYVPWANMMYYPAKLNEIGIQCNLAPLADNEFNRSKSNIKFTESCYMGWPLVAQNMEPYKMAFNLFDTGAECIDMLKAVLKDEDTYAEQIKKHRAEADKYWLDDKIDDIKLIYSTPYGDSARKNIKWFVELNEDQFQ